MAFKPLKIDSGKTLSVLATNSTAFTKYCGVKFTSGRADVSASGDRSVDFVSLEAKTTGTDSQLLVLRVDPSIQFECDTSAAVTQANVGVTYDVANSTHLDVAATTDKAFTISNIVPGNNTKVIGYFREPIA